MRNVFARKLINFPILLIVLFLILAIVSCASPANSLFSPNQQSVVIDWVNFIYIGGITYLAGPTKPGRSIAKSDLGTVFSTITFKLEGNVHDPGYQHKNGDAAFLDAGTRVYTVKGYSPTFRLAVLKNNVVTLYEADTNPHARKGGDLLDIYGKVRYIGIVSAQDGVTEIGAITDSNQVASLITLLRDAPVDQNRRGGNQQYFLVFHLVDGTMVARDYWLDSGVLARGILMPEAFGLAVKAALPQ